jgi:predicted nuclease with TOPRIM domain
MANEKVAIWSGLITALITGPFMLVFGAILSRRKEAREERKAQIEERQAMIAEFTAKNNELRTELHHVKEEVRLMKQEEARNDENIRRLTQMTVALQEQNARLKLQLEAFRLHFRLKGLDLPAGLDIDNEWLGPSNMLPERDNGLLEEPD